MEVTEVTEGDIRSAMSHGTSVIAAQAVCGGCKVYGVLEVLAPSAHESQRSDDGASEEWFKVRCRKCGHDWTMAAMQTEAPDKKYL